MRMLLDPLGLGMTDLVGQIDGSPGIFYSEASSIQDVFVDNGMQVGETIGKLEFFIVEGQRPISGFARFSQFTWDIRNIEGEEPTDVGTVKFQITSDLSFILAVNLKKFNVSKDPYEHIEEMDADIGGNTS